jgi:outer membrane biogenesis lipoprotein LolB
MSRRTLVLLIVAALLTGCAPTAARQVPASPGDATVEPSPDRDCSRQFDENDAGFQTCLDADEGPTTP